MRTLARSNYIYILLHADAAEKVCPEQCEKAFDIATDRAVPMHETAQCQEACVDEQKLGHAVAIIKLGKSCLHGQSPRMLHRNLKPGNLTEAGEPLGRRATPDRPRTEVE